MRPVRSKRGLGMAYHQSRLLQEKNVEPKIDVEPDAWATKTMCIGPRYGETRYAKLPIQSIQPGFYSHEKLYSEKTVLGLMKAAYYDGYTEREKEIREIPNV